MRRGLPTENRAGTLAAALVNFEALLTGRLLSFCGSGMSDVFGTIHGWIKALSANRVPDVGSDTSSFCVEMRMQIAFFYTHTYPADHTNAGTSVSGRNAVMAAFEECETGWGTPTATMIRLTPLQLYGWCLTPDMQKTVAKWTTALKAQGSGQAAASSTDIAKTAQRGRKRLNPDAAATLSKLFTNG